MDDTDLPANSPNLGSVGITSLPNLFKTSAALAGNIPDPLATDVFLIAFCNIAASIAEGVPVGDPPNSPDISEDSCSEIVFLVKSDTRDDDPALLDGSNPYISGYFEDNALITLNARYPNAPFDILSL